MVTQIENKNKTIHQLKRKTGRAIELVLIIHSFSLSLFIYSLSAANDRVLSDSNDFPFGPLQSEASSARVSFAFVLPLLHSVWSPPSV